MKLASTFIAFVLLLLGTFSGGSAQDNRYTGVKSQETSDADGVPVLLKHLPEWEAVKGNAAFITDKDGLRLAIGDRPINELIDFAGGTEAASANYPAGTLLIVEYTNPQLSVAADQAFQQWHAANPEIVYRRIGNYNAFVFDTPDAIAANALLDQVKYEKQVQWLGEDPFLIQKIERYFALTGRDVAISTVLWICLVFAITIAIGVLAGIWYFRYREKKRSTMTAFSDAGGLTRLNLDELSEPLP